MLSVEYRLLAEPDPYGTSLRTKIGFKALWVRNCVISGRALYSNNKIFGGLLSILEVSHLLH
jgi:hypothetical protein